MKKRMCLLFVLVVCRFVYSAPSDNSFVVSTEASKENEKEGSADSSSLYPVIYEMDIKSNISNRFAKTVVISKVKNGQQSAKETTFNVVLPEKAFISEFVMEIGGKSYKAYVKEKEEARRDYSRAVASGQSAGHVAVSARDSNRFTVSINIEPESKATFILTYEELLDRKDDQYELVLNIHPGQIVKHMIVEVLVNESRPLKFVRTPSIRSGNEISKNEEKLNPSSDIQIINSTSAIVKFSPDPNKQKEFARYLGGKESDGLSGQFVVQYDVERDPHGGEVLLQDGYFIHFFAPSDLEPLPKHVVFVLDTSGSMGGTKISQLKDAMKSILDEIKIGDIVNLVEFNNKASIWDIVYENKTDVPSLYGKYENPFSELSEFSLPAPTLVTKETIEKAKNITDKIYASGGTNIIEALDSALYLIKSAQENNTQHTDKKHQPIIIFLTDGEPNIGIDSTEGIVRIVTKLNSETNNVPLFSLSFGYGADKEFLKKLSLKNQGFSRHIYEASDASLQLQEFYKQISSPLLSNVNFKYESEVKEVTKTHFPIFFRGSELVVAGKYEDSFNRTLVDCWGPSGPLILRPTVERPVTSLERLWAYLTVKQTLEKRDAAENKTVLNKKALDLALKYSFVTDVTSLVVVKPNETSAVDTEEASGDSTGPSGLRHIGGTGGLTTFGRAAISQPRPMYHLPNGYSSGSDLLSIRIDSDIDSDSLGIPQPLDLHGSSVWYKANIDTGTYPTTTIASITYPTTNVEQISNTTSTTAKPDLKSSLPWLISALNSNGSLTIEQNTYELGENVSVTGHDECPKTPFNSTQSGICTLLKDCRQVYPYLTDFQVYRQYFCLLDNRYAGVCCPKKQTSK